MRRLLAIALVLCTPLMSLDLCERCWEVGGAALYWKPCASYTYGFDEVNANNGRKLVINPDYDWGFRIFGSTYTHDCCHLFWADWTYLRTDDSIQDGDATNLTIFPLDNDIPTVNAFSARLKTRYNKVTIRAGRYVSDYCVSRGYAFGGLRYVDIEMRREARANGPTTELRFNSEKAEFEGGALEAGYGVVVEEPFNFSLVGRFSGLMAIGERRYRQQVTEDATAFDYGHESETACIPGLEFVVGVQYRYETCGMWFDLELGYELDYYFDALRLMTPATNDNVPPISVTNLNGVGFAGPYLQASVRF